MRRILIPAVVGAMLWATGHTSSLADSSILDSSPVKAHTLEPVDQEEDVTFEKVGVFQDAVLIVGTLWEDEGGPSAGGPPLGMLAIALTQGLSSEWIDLSGSSIRTDPLIFLCNPRCRTATASVREFTTASNGGSLTADIEDVGALNLEWTTNSPSSGALWRGWCQIGLGNGSNVGIGGQMLGASPEEGPRILRSAVGSLGSLRFEARQSLHSGRPTICGHELRTGAAELVIYSSKTEVTQEEA